MKNFILIIYFILISGILSISKGMDRSFDVRNYHIYNPYAFLNNRINIDIMPADIQTYFNPLMDIPYYLMVKHLNNFPYIVTFIQGLSYALLLFLIYKIADYIFKSYHKTLITILSVLVGGTAALTLYNIGTLTHDIFVGDVILISIYLIIKSFDKYSNKNIVISGILLGGICGLKLTASIFAVAMILGIIVFCKKLKPKAVFWIISSCTLGFLITNGFWMYKLFTEFGNPLFPYFNNIFHSDYVNCGNILKEDFINLYPQNIFEYIFFPFYFYQHLPVKAFEINYQDFRFAAIYIVLILNIITSFWYKKLDIQEKYGINYDIINFLLTFCVFSYIIWINTFATVRYLTPIAAISGVIVFASLIKFYEIIETKFNLKNLPIEDIELSYKKTLLPTMIIFAGLYLTFTTIEPKMLKRIPIENKLLYVDNMHIPNNSTVIAISGSGMLIPFQNPNARYIYLNAPRFTERHVNILSDKVQQEIKELIASNPDKTYFMMDLAIYNKTFRLTQKALKEYMDIDFDKSQCKILETNIKSKKTMSFYILCKTR